MAVVGPPRPFVVGSFPHMGWSGGKAVKRGLIDLLIALAILALGLWQNLAYVDSTKFHRDESRWIHRAYYLREAIHPLSHTWDDGYLTRGQPPLGSYLMGLGLVVQGRDLNTNGLWNFDKNNAWNRSRGRMPVKADLEAARRTNSVVGALLAVTLYFLGKRLGNRLAGLVAALVLIPHPLNIYLSSLAGSDALLALLVALAALTAVSLADRPTWWRVILLGGLLGLGGATKLSPLLLTLPLAGVGAALLIHKLPERATGGGPSRQDQDTGWMLLSLPFVAFAVFVACYPYLWRDPIDGTKALFEFRAQEMESQGEIWENLQVSGPADALARVNAALGEQMTTSGRLAELVDARFGFTWGAPWLDLALGTAGLGLLGLLAVMYGLRSRYALGGIVLTGQAAIILLGMRADFARYHLPILVTVALGAGLLVGYGWWALRLLADRGRALASRRAWRSAPAAMPVSPEPVHAGGASLHSDSPDARPVVTAAATEPIVPPTAAASPRPSPSSPQTSPIAGVRSRVSRVLPGPLAGRR